MPSQPERKHFSYLFSIIFFISGASALIFESIWFHQAGLNLGNSVWASSIVLASFMAGLAIGSAIIAIIGDKIHFPLRFYVCMEITIAVFGVLTILLFSKSIPFLKPVYSLLATTPAFLNFSRSVIAFSFMLIPTIAMGITLPLLVKALYKHMPNFGQILGLLYGWNTLGALTGVLLNELFLIKYFGIWGAGLFAGSLNITAAFSVLFLARRESAILPSTQTVTLDPLRYINSLNQPVIGSFMAGAILLALEVVWFRVLLLFFNSHSWNFAIMLATVLAGISLGGLFASKWSKRNSEFHHYLFYMFLLNGLFVVLLYGNFILVLKILQQFRTDRFILLAAIYLMFPVSFVSGVIFTMLVKSFHSSALSESRAASILAMSNTTGAMLGTLIAGFILIPDIGTEKAFFLLALVYGMTAFVFKRSAVKLLLFKRIDAAKALGVFFVMALLFFPFGSMENSYSNISSELYRTKEDEKRVVWREGLTETIQYIRKDIGTRPYYYRLLTNNYSMSTTSLMAKRYMKFFVYWPVALLDAPKKALLICFGSGSTAKALTDTKSLEEIDIVDTSKDILELSNVIYPDPKDNPTKDKRVNLHVEDGRFYLQTSEKKYDIITAEPPPPSFNGVVNLYTQEYFHLIHSRLETGGIATYWLPVYQLRPSDSKAVIKAFCNEFADCSLWAGGGLEWMLAGTKNINKPVSVERFRQQWEDRVVGSELRKVGFTNPEQFGASFIADGPRLQEWVASSKPLVDNFPHRLSPVNRQWKEGASVYREFMDLKDSFSNFMTSKNVARYWPALMIDATKKYFPSRWVINELLMGAAGTKYSQLYILHLCLHDPDLKEYIPWALNSDYYAIEIVKDILKTKPEIELDPTAIKQHLVAIAAMSGNYSLAEQILASNTQQTTKDGSWREIALRIYFLILSGEKEKMEQVSRQYVANSSDPVKTREKISEVINWSEKAISTARKSHKDE